MKNMVKMFTQNGYKPHEIFEMKMKDIVLLNEMLDSGTVQNELTEDFLSMLGA